jgi:uncharacterized protein YukE
MGFFGPLGDALDDGISAVSGAVSDTVEAGVEVVSDTVHAGVDLASDVVTYEVDAAGNVLDAAGHVIKAEINAAGQVVDAAGTVIGAAKDFATSPYGILGPIGLPLWGLSTLFGHDDPSKAEQVAALGGGQPNADVILDLASDCERLFEVWRPRMVAAGQNPGTTWDQAAAMFDRERGMSFATLRADAQHLSDTVTQLADASSAQRAEAQSLASTWQGDGGTAAQTYLTGFQSTCGSVIADLVKGGAALNACADQLEKAVKDKAQAVLPLYQETIGGTSPADVDDVIAASKLDGDSWIDKVAGLLGFTFLGPLSLLTDSLFDELKHEIAESARGWLQDVFAPSYTQAADSFVRICDATSDSVREIYGVAAQAFDGLDPAGFTPLGTGIPGPVPVAKPGPVAQEPTPDKPGATDQGSGGQGSGGGGGVPGGGGGGMPGGGGGGMPGGAPGASPSPVASQGLGPVPGGDQVTGPVPATTPPVAPTTVPVAPATVPVGLPQGAGWVSDPATLPQGWTIDPGTGQLLPPGAPGSAGDPEVHSSAADALLDGDGNGDLGSSAARTHGPGSTDPGGAALPGAGTVVGGPASTDPLGGAPGAASNGVTGSVITVADDGVSMQISASDAGGPGAHVQVTDAAGEVSGYRVEIGPDGAPQLVPDPAATAPVAAPSTAPVAATAPARTPDVTASGGGAPSGQTAGGSPVGQASTFEARSDSAPAAGVTSGGGGAPSFGAQDAAGSSSDPGTAAAVAPGPEGPVAAQVRSAAVGSPWSDPQGGAQHDGSGASLASTQATTGTHAASGAVLAGTEDGASSGSSAGGPSGMAGTGGAAGGGGGSEPQEHRVSQQWRVLDDTFTLEARTWSSFSDVLGEGGTSDEEQVER